MRKEPATAESVRGARRAPSSRSAGALDCAQQDACTAPCGPVQHASTCVFSTPQQARQAGGARLSNKLTSIATITAWRMVPFYASGNFLVLRYEKIEVLQLSGAACFGVPQSKSIQSKLPPGAMCRRKPRAKQITCTGLRNG
jgi:hypothetical protein